MSIDSYGYQNWRIFGAHLGGLAVHFQFEALERGGGVTLRFAAGQEEAMLDHIMTSLERCVEASLHEDPEPPPPVTFAPAPTAPFVPPPLPTPGSSLVPGKAVSPSAAPSVTEENGRVVQLPGGLTPEQMELIRQQDEIIARERAKSSSP